MSREIKFRVWNPELERMYKIKKENYLGSVGIIDNLVGGKESKWMQFTGLKDKNGVEIYEGDIVQTGWQGNEKGVVVFDSPTYCVDSGNGYMYFNHPESYEVIGNIYENPELLD